MRTEARREPCRIMAVIELGEGAPERLAAAAQAARLAAVVAHVTPRELAPGRSVLEAVRLLQSQGVAVLAAGDAALARAIGADGIHLVLDTSEVERGVKAARAALGPAANIGLDAGHSRHDAMTAGEAGADYVAFSLMARDGARGSGIEPRRALVEWWAELFEVPVVALEVTSAEEARELAAAGADFVGVTISHGRSPADVAAQFRAISAAIETVVAA